MPDNGERVVANRITLPSIDLPQVVRVSYHPPFRYWRKAAILLRPRRTPVDVIVPRAWRDRVAVTWGDSGLASSVHFLGCPQTGEEWLPYTGGFYVREPMCVPLVVRAGRQQATLRFGVGASC